MKRTDFMTRKRTRTKESFLCPGYQWKISSFGKSEILRMKKSKILVMNFPRYMELDIKMPKENGMEDAWMTIIKKDKYSRPDDGIVIDTEEILYYYEPIL